MGLAAALGVPSPVTLRDAEVALTLPAPVRVGEAGELSLTILERPWVGAPVELWLSSEHVVLHENRLAWEDVVDPMAQQPRLRAKFLAPEQPGIYGVQGWVLYVSCGPQRCRPRTRPVLWTITVTPATP
jgi:hypothetical protein